MTNPINLVTVYIHMRHENVDIHYFSLPGPTATPVVQDTTNESRRSAEAYHRARYSTVFVPHCKAPLHCHASPGHPTFSVTSDLLHLELSDGFALSNGFTLWRLRDYTTLASEDSSLLHSIPPAPKCDSAKAAGKADCRDGGEDDEEKEGVVAGARCEAA